MSEFKKLDDKKLEDCDSFEQSEVVQAFLECVNVVPGKHGQMVATLGSPAARFITNAEVLELLEVYEYVDQPTVYKILHKVVYLHQPWVQFSD